MSDIKIDKDVPMPERQTKYPFGEMTVGDSFFVADKTPDQLQNSASTYRKNRGMKFAARSVTEDGVDGARIWRTK